tara:strand:- start:78875 stop:79660 length:786 start_codon:yes stop_codon:yes gene_type:complete
VVANVKNFPILLQLRRTRFEYHFRNDCNVNYFRGVYPSFKHALQDAPNTKRHGYDNAPAARMYKERTERVYSTDYPVLYWLTKFQSRIQTVFDFGGHIGVHFYSYQKYFSFSNLTSWTVCEVPAVIDEARKFPLYEKGTILNFVTDVSNSDGYDLFLANGSLQYLEWELHEKLRRLNRLPKFLIVNMLPLHKNTRTITLQSIGTSFCPYLLRKRSEFISGLEGLGYELLDEWNNEEKSCAIAFETERSLDHYKGMTFAWKH